jgi:hypothetical protein
MDPDPDPDPGGLKTYISNGTRSGFGSATLIFFLDFVGYSFFLFVDILESSFNCK